MKKIKFLFILIIAILLLPCFFAACKDSGSKKSYKTAEPLSTYRYKNIFELSYYDTTSIDLIAKKVLIYNDFSADITYEIADKTLEKGEEENQQNSVKKDDIIKAIDSFNKDIYFYEGKHKLYEQGNRVLYLDESSIEEISFNEEETIKAKIVLNVYVTNLNYVSTYYKLMSLEDYIKSEDDKTNVTVLQKKYSNFFYINEAGKPEGTSIKGMENPENFMVLVLEESPSTETEFTFENEIIAFYNRADTPNETDKKSITIKPSGTNYIAIMYQLENNSINWAILGPVIGVSAIFLFVLSIKIIKSAKRPAAKKGY